MIRERQRKFLFCFIMMVLVGMSWPTMVFAKHDMVGRWQLEGKCTINISILTIMVENDQAVLFCFGDDHAKRMAPLGQEKGDGTVIYRERDNTTRWYQVKANKWIEVYDDDRLLCTGRPVITSGGMPLPEPEEEDDHGH